MRVALSLLALTGAMLGLLSGCELVADPPSSPICDAGPEAMMVILDTEPPIDPLSADLVVSGRVERAGNTAVRRVTVAGVPVREPAFNFESWSVTVPIGTLRALAASSTVGGVGSATLNVLAEDACGLQAEAQLVVPVRSAAGEVLDLSVSVSAPDPALSFLPVDATTPGRIRVSAAPSAVGATVHVSTSLGLLDGSAPSVDRLLSPDEMGQASAILLLTSGTSGLASIGVSAGAQRADTTIVFVDPPSIAPAGGTLRPGQAMVAVARSEGLLAECEASITGAFAVTRGGVPVTAAPLMIGERSADLRVEAQATAERTEARLRCRDPYGQSGTAVFENIP